MGTPLLFGRARSRFPAKRTTLPATIHQNGNTISARLGASSFKASTPASIWPTTAIRGDWSTTLSVAPHADPSAIRLAFDGAKPRLAENGDLVLAVNGREMEFAKPEIYQLKNGTRQPVSGTFSLAQNNQVQFALGDYDRTRELIIDPTLVYTGTFGTASESDIPSGMAVDAKGELLIVGTTYNLDFPSTSGAFQTSCGPVSATDTQNGYFRCASGDQPGAMPSAYVAKLSADGTSLIYATYLHGITGWETGAAVQADASGNAVVVGQTSSSDFPLVNAPPSHKCRYASPDTPRISPVRSRVRRNKAAMAITTAAGPNGPLQAHLVLSPN